MASNTSTFLDVGVIYVIYPKDGTDGVQTSLIEKKLRALSDPPNIYISQTKTVGINFWFVTLSHGSADILAVELAHEVASIYPQTPKDIYNPRYSTFDPTTGITYKESQDHTSTVADHLMYVCQQPGKSLREYHGRYYFDDADPVPGRGIPVYVVDTGATLDHKEFDDVRDNVEWIHVGQDVGGGNAEDDSATDPTQQFITAKAHGTSMLSLVTGANVGVSKGVKPYLVRVPRRHIPTGTVRDRSRHATNEDWLEGISKVNDHLAGRKNDTKAIILLAFHIPRESFMRDGKDRSLGFDARLRFLLKDLVDKGVLPITGTGNNMNQASTIDGFPANYGRSDYNPITEVLVVRSVHSTSFALANQTDFDRGLPHIFAPGYGIKCAEGNRGAWGLFHDPKDDTYKRAHGSSCAAAITAGLADYFLRLSQVGRLNIVNNPMGLKNYILSDDLKWSRKLHQDGRALPGIWNGVKLPDSHFH
ncbi:peptidase S8/S53 domain-containing protein [Annulohypoxylon bovei var. microspora]|nr:peptidase S8/S53 domain-containing protein [Annulohypoxylon bovei var. microspora]